MKKKLLLIACTFLSCGAGINFGSQQSSFIVNNGSTLDNQASNQMQINGGNLANTGFGTITGSTIKFNKGVYTFFNSVSNLDGFVNPTSNLITLNAAADPFNDGGTMIANPGGLQGVQILAGPGGNILRGQPLFFGPQDITLTGGSLGTILALAVQNTLNTNIILDNCALELQDDLRLGDVASVLDSGLIALNDRRLSTGGTASTWDGNIFWLGVGELQINSELTLNGIWQFFNTVQLNGNGNVIDISNGGIIYVASGSTLRLASVHIKGLGLGQGSILLAPGGTLILTDTIIEMNSDYHINSGTVIIEGNSTIITKEFLLKFKDSHTTGVFGNLQVNGAALTYDTYGSIDNLNIRPALAHDPDSKHVQLINNGDIRNYNESPYTFHSYTIAGKLVKYLIVAPYRPFQFFPTPLGGDTFDYNVTFDGNTNFMGFTKIIPDEDNGFFIVSKDVQATIQNVYLRDMSPKHIKLHENASLTFGDLTRISLIDNEVLHYPWVFEGNTILKGSGQILELRDKGAIVLTGSNSQLLLDGITLQGVKHDNIRCLSDTSTIQLKNVKWVQTGHFTYNLGALDILDDTTIFGPFQFTYNSVRPITISPSATLSLIRNLVFNITPTDDNQNTIQFDGPTAALLLNEATLAAPTGTLLDIGRLVIQNYAYVSGSVNIGPNLFIDGPTPQQI